MDEKRSSAAPVFVALLLLLPLLYFGSYAVLVEHRMSPVFSIADGKTYVTHPKHPSYRVGGEFAASLFAPAYWLDRKLRPQHWEEAPLSFDDLTLGDG